MLVCPYPPSPKSEKGEIRMKRTIGGAAIAAGAVMALLVSSGLANANTGSVSPTPAAWTPYVTSADAMVRQIVQCGNTMYAVGTFSTVGSPGKADVVRNNAFSFSATTGAITSWNPNTNGIVNSIALSPDCSTAYLGGAFKKVGGTAVTRLAKVNTTTGALDKTFAPAPDGEVLALLDVSGRLLVGGAFTTIAATTRSAFAAISPTTGKFVSYVAMSMAGTISGSSKKVYNFALSHSGTKLLVMGSFTSVLGTPRKQLFMADLGATAVTLDPWYAPALSQNCATWDPVWVRDAAWSADDKTVYAAATGYKGTSPLCDAISKFSSSASSTQKPVWINKTGCDSVFTVAADDTQVYVGGHQRWLGNPNGCDKAGTGASSRPGIGSIFLADGTVTPWNPTRDRGKGADDLLLTSAGLWVASDNQDSSYLCGGAYHPGICFFPR